MSTNLEVVRGDDEAFDVTIARAGVPLDITAATLKFTAKKRLSDPTPLISKTSPMPGGIDIVDPTAGKAVLYLTPGDTEDLGPGSVQLIYDVELTEVTGKKTTVARGFLVVKYDVTA